MHLFKLGGFPKVKGENRSTSFALLESMINIQKFHIRKVGSENPGQKLLAFSVESIKPFFSGLSFKILKLV